jgi:hypothetical protein
MLKLIGSKIDAANAEKLWGYTVMLSSTEILLEKGFGSQVFKDWDVASTFGGTPARSYALINKAIKKNEIVRLCRGIYILGQKYRAKNMSAFYVSSRMVAGSYVSFETALSFHGWIPEGVPVVKCVIAKGRTRNFNTTLGEFHYVKIPVNAYEFLRGVIRKEIGGKPFLIASPLRALADYVYFKKIEWVELNFLLDSLRIEMESLESLTVDNFEAVSAAYDSKKVLVFLQKLKEALGK